MKIADAGELQALIAYHAATIVTVITDNGIKPSKQPILVKTCERMVELAKALNECELDG
jgi:hypothetical protein